MSVFKKYKYGSLYYWMYDYQKFWKHVLSKHDGKFQINNLQLAQKLFKLLKMVRGTVIIADIGANIGMNSLNFSKDANLIYAIEPQTKVYKQLCKNIKANKITNVKTFKIAFGKDNGESKLYIGKNSNDGENHIALKSEKITEPIIMSKMSDFFIDKPINYIKMDIEGYEYFALLGATEIFKIYKPIIVLEIAKAESKRYIKDMPEKIFNYFKHIGYYGPIVNSGRIIKSYKVSPSTYTDFWWFPDDMWNRGEIQQKNNNSYWKPKIHP